MKRLRTTVSSGVSTPVETDPVQAGVVLVTVKVKVTPAKVDEYAAGGM
jgi:hypothetical protein